MNMRKGFAGIGILASVLLAVITIGGVVYSNYNQRNSVLSVSTSVFESTQLANQDGASLTTGKNWIGNGQSIDSSYLGIIYEGSAIPKGADIQSARIEFTTPEDYWLYVSVDIYAENSIMPQNFSSSSLPSSRLLTIARSAQSDNVKWEKGVVQAYDVTSVIRELVNTENRSRMAVVIKGTGTRWGRKFIDNKSRLVVSYVSGTQTVTPAPTPVATITPSSTKTPIATVSPTKTPTPTPSSSPSPTPTMQPTATPQNHGGSSSGDIFGLVSADILGTCAESVHNKYVTRGPDGKLYRTWHPPVDPETGCRFAHEHGDDPASSNIFNGSVPFGYVAAQLNPPMDEPHAGFKCFVHNKGTRNDEGRVMQHDSYFCFHMGTGGVGRYTARFHSLDFHFRSALGQSMRLSGMADVGNVGTICDNPRQQRTVQGFGCLLDSPYEIWENRLFIRNRGNVVASAIVSTAVFDPITSMDPSDKTRVVYSWSDEAQSKIFKYNDNRNYFRGCEREAYSGPIAFYNRGGSEVYYTDPYGNVVDGGPVRQVVSVANTRDISGYVDQYGALRMTESSFSQPQFKYYKSACVPGLGLKN